MSKAAATGFSSQTQQRLEAIFRPWNSRAEPGVAAGIALQGRPIYRVAFGMASLEGNVELTPATRMRIGSVSKHFTAALALVLHERGVLDVDRPIRTYLPELTGPSGEASVRLLLQHRGGVRCHIDLGHLCRGNSPPPPGTALAALKRQSESNFRPGTGMIYSNGGYHLVSLALERASQRSFEDLMSAELFHPLGLQDTASLPSDYDIHPATAALHIWAGHRWRRGLFPSEEIRGEGGLVSTVDDLLVWLNHLRSAGYGRFATWAALTDPPIFPDGASSHYALGLMSQQFRGIDVVRHGGAVAGGSAEILVVPRYELDIVILTNGARDAHPEWLAEQALLAILGDSAAASPPPMSTEAHEQLLGNWWSPKTEMLYRIAPDASGALAVSVCNEPRSWPLVQCGDAWIVQPRNLSRIEFAPGATPSKLLIRFGGQVDVYERLSLPAEMPVSLAGQYTSEDGQCLATIAGDDYQLEAWFTDGYGTAHVNLSRLANVVVTAEPKDRSSHHWSTLTFDSRAGVATAFRLNSSRTRHLQFERRSSSADTKCC